ncbi:MAG TPA: trypsin-like peptidase domain-containing protein [Candidatus Acidoferrales bacterium]|nr:trypsin-like peptidase domain-containing protein [Candidatus Acidoferrales bacterium]
MEAKKILAPLLAGLIGGVGGGALVLSHYDQRAGDVLMPAAVAAGEDDQQQIIEAVHNAKASVVALNVVVNGKQIVPSDPFGALFGNGFGGEQLVPFHGRASGSGFVYSKDGLIVTNDHVVHGASSIQVVFSDGRKVKGKIYAEDHAADIALVKVNTDHLPPPLELASSNDIRQGEWAIAIGEPLQLKDTVTLGVVSGFNRDETIGGDGGFPQQFKGLLQTSAPINPGNSGGPLLAMDGRVIGINQSVARPAEGIGFAIPVDTVKQTVAYLEQHPGAHADVASGFMGVQLAPIADVRSQIDYKGNGVAIVGVVSGTAADKAGLEPGDVIQDVNGKPVTTPAQVKAIVGPMKPGQVASLRVWSSGVKRLVAVHLEQAPSG